MQSVRFASMLLALLSCSALAHPGKLDDEGCHRDGDRRHCHRQTKTHDVERPPKPGEEGILDGRLIWVTDGDSLRVLVRGQDMEVRLADVDAPEREQPHGWESKLQLIDLVRGQHIVLAPQDVDQYGRIVARVWVGELDVNRELVRSGAAWFYPEYADDESLYDEEQAARKERRGLWALPLADRIEPWEWRKRARASSSRSERQRGAPGQKAR